MSGSSIAYSLHLQCWNASCLSMNRVLGFVYCLHTYHLPLEVHLIMRYRSFHINVYVLLEGNTACDRSALGVYSTCSRYSMHAKKVCLSCGSGIMALSFCKCISFLCSMIVREKVCLAHLSEWLYSQLLSVKVT